MISRRPRVHVAFVMGALAVIAGTSPSSAQTGDAPPSTPTPTQAPAVPTPTHPSPSTPGTSAPDPCRLPTQLPLAAQVNDPVFAVLIGLTESDLCGVLTRGRLEWEIKASGRRTHIPVPYLHAIRRAFRTDGPHAEVSFLSVEDLDLPIPYDILGYHPGRMRASADLLFEEWMVGRVLVDNPGGSPIVLEDVRLWGLRHGRVQMDIDGWLDALLGPKLDDMELEGFALCRYKGQRVGFGLGFGPKGSGRSGGFDFLKDEVIFPNPPEFKRAGAYLRARLEHLMPNLAVLRTHSS